MQSEPVSASEDENIKVVDMPISEFWASLERQEISDLKMLTLALALRCKLLRRSIDEFLPEVHVSDRRRWQSRLELW